MNLGVMTGFVLSVDASFFTWRYEEMIKETENKRLGKSISTCLLCLLCMAIVFAFHKVNNQGFDILIYYWFYIASAITCAAFFILFHGYSRKIYQALLIVSPYWGYAVVYLIRHDADYGY